MPVDLCRKSVCVPIMANGVHVPVDAPLDVPPGAAGDSDEPEVAAQAWLEFAPVRGAAQLARLAGAAEPVVAAGLRAAAEPVVAAEPRGTAGPGAAAGPRRPAGPSVAAVPRGAVGPGAAAVPRGAVGPGVAARPREPEQRRFDSV